MRIGTSWKIMLSLTLVAGLAAAETVPGAAKAVTVIDISRSGGGVRSIVNQGLAQGIRPGDRAFIVEKGNSEVVVGGLVVSGVSASTSWVVLPNSPRNWEIANGTGKKFELRVIPGGTCSTKPASVPQGPALSQGNADWGVASVELEPFRKGAPGWISGSGSLRAGFRDGATPGTTAFVVVDGMIVGAAKATLRNVSVGGAAVEIENLPESLANKGIRIAFARAACAGR